MPNILFKKETKPVEALINGGQAKVLDGFFATKDLPRDFDQRFFNSSRTIILGSREGKSSAEWYIPFSKNVIDRAEHGLLLIACERTHGGLHSRIERKTATITLNGYQKDVIKLKDIPPGHTDFFHRPTKFDTMDIWPISLCPTVYSWPVYKNELLVDGPQTLRVELDDHITWDIDYVGIILVTTQLRIREGVIEIILLILGAIFGAMATYFLGI